MNEVGARFRRCDFQIHSPRDSQWKGDRPAGTPEVVVLKEIESERQEWAFNFLDACVKKGLEAVAITDHHEMVFSRVVIETLHAHRSRPGYSNLWVFPGMELTCADSSQAIVIFDCDMPQALCNKVRGILKLQAEFDELAAVGIQVKPIQHNVSELHSLLSSDPEISGRFIVLPNVSSGGYKTILRNGFHTRFRTMPYCGGYLDAKTPAQMKVGDQRVIKGEIPEWRTSSLGVIATSDSRVGDFSTLGTPAAYIKLAEPTAESIRQAMLAHGTRLSHSEPAYPTHSILSIQIRGSKVFSDCTIDLNRNFNVVIGGRGAGKSTLLEYVRFTLGGSAVDASREELKSDPTLERRQRLVYETLDQDEGAITVSAISNGAVVQYERTRSSENQVAVTVDGSTNYIRPDQVRVQLQFQAFSQGELSDLGEERAESRLIELMFDTERAPLDALKSARHSIARKIKELIPQLVNYWADQQKAESLKAQIDALQAQHRVAQASLSDLAEADRVLLEAHPTYEKGSKYIQSVRQSINSTISELPGKFDAMRLMDRHGLDTEQPEFEPLLQVDAVLQSFNQRLDDIRDNLLLELTNARSDIEIHAKAWDKVRQQHDSSFTEVATKATSNAKAMTSIQTLKRQIDQHQVEYDKLNLTVTQRSGLAKRFHELMDAYESSQLDYIQLAHKIAGRVSQISDGYAEARPKAVQNIFRLRTGLENALEGGRVRSSRVDSVMDELAGSAAPLREWRKVVNEFYSLLRWKVGQSQGQASRPHLPLLSSAFHENTIKHLESSMNQSRLSAAACAYITPAIHVVHKRNGREKPFRDASQGEQATVLLKILLNQDAGILLVDQPEEDLDNKIIGDVISSITKAKSGRQIVFATHNANLVVNGDAEAAIVLDNGSVIAAGAIDHSVVREEIISTMDGGREAFNLRRQKYNF